MSSEPKLKPGDLILCFNIFYAIVIKETYETIYYRRLCFKEGVNKDYYYDYSMNENGHTSNKDVIVLVNCVDSS
jgi:hypothetical protein